MKTRQLSRFIQKYLCLVLLSAMLAFPVSSSAFFNVNDTDREKPKPEFTQDGENIVAKLIPRAKSNSITILFKATGGTLSQVAGFDINKTLGPQINQKDFRSELFSVDIEGVAPGGEATLSLSSSFFSSATSFWIFNQGKTPPWVDSQAEHTLLAEKVQELKIRIRDGGALDSDGSANGRITLIGGPSDSFWGYVLGTLFIRFFGVFIVLAVLMIGMILSGLVFQNMEKKAVDQKAPPAMPAEAPTKPVAADAQPTWTTPNVETIPPEMAAAIGVALALELSPTRNEGQAPDSSCEASNSSSWVMDGRQRIMADRSMAFNRNKH